MKRLLPLFLVTVLLAGCTNRQAEVLIKDAANVVQAFEREVTLANHAGMVDDATEVKLLNVALLIAKEDDFAADAILHQGSASTALAHVDAALSDLDMLIANDLSGIKDPNKKTELQAILVGLRGTLVTAKALLTK